MQKPTSAKTVHAFTLTELVATAVLLGLAAAIFVPRVMPARKPARLDTIHFNLRTLEGAKEAWLFEHRRGKDAAVGSTPTLAEFARGGGARAVEDEQPLSHFSGFPAGTQLVAGANAGPDGSDAVNAAP